MKRVKPFNKEPVKMDWTYWDNPDNFRVFLKDIFKIADTICLTYHGDYDDFMKSEWSFLKDSVVDYEYTKETPTSRGPSVMLAYLKIDKKTKEWLFGKSGIGDFNSSVSKRTRLDDLCFIKDGKVVFCSCTHEEFCYISEEYHMEATHKGGKTDGSISYHQSLLTR